MIFWYSSNWSTLSFFSFISNLIFKKPPGRGVGLKEDECIEVLHKQKFKYNYVKPISVTFFSSPCFADIFKSVKYFSSNLYLKRNVQVFNLDLINGLLFYLLKCHNTYAISLSKQSYNLLVYT